MEQEHFKQKNKRRIIIITFAALLGLAALFAWLQSRVLHLQEGVEMNVYPLKLSIKDTLHYVDKTAFGKTRRWTFGDGNISLSDSGSFQYSKPGYYQVSLLIDNKYSKTVNVQVIDNTKSGDLQDSVVTIDAPKIAMQFENIVFRCNVKGAKLYSWKFGESGSIDSKDPMVIYSYQRPGNYTVMVYTETTKYPVMHKIQILPSYKASVDSISLDDGYKKIDDDFKWHLQQIANGNAFNEHYNYLLKTYLCRNEKVVMKVNETKLNDFNSYCLGLQFDKRSIIQSVKVGFDDKQNCVTKVEVQQSDK